MAERLETSRLVLRTWQLADAPAALAVYGNAKVARWLSPNFDLIPDLPAMRLLLGHWIDQDSRLSPPCGRWAIERAADAQVIGGAIVLPLPPRNEDLEMAWELHPDAWGFGFATETTQALARWVFSQDVDELFGVVKPGNTRAAKTVRRNGMEWVGETDKYFGRTLEVFRLRAGDFDPDAPTTYLPPTVGRSKSTGTADPVTESSPDSVR